MDVCGLDHSGSQPFIYGHDINSLLLPQFISSYKGWYIELLASMAYKMTIFG